MSKSLFPTLQAEVLISCCKVLEHDEFQTIAEWLRSRVYWPGMYKDLQEYLAGCTVFSGDQSSAHSENKKVQDDVDAIDKDGGDTPSRPCGGKAERLDRGSGNFAEKEEGSEEMSQVIPPTEMAEVHEARLDFKHALQESEIASGAVEKLVPQVEAVQRGCETMVGAHGDVFDGVTKSICFQHPDVKTPWYQEYW